MARVRRKSEENLTKDSIQRVIRELSSDTPITKKKACGMLNIAYNTTRLNKIIEGFIEEQEYAAARRKELRTKPLSDSDKSYIVKSYLDGDSLSDISGATFRSIPVVKRVVKQYNVPLRDAKDSYFMPALLDEASIADDYKAGDLVYSAQYGLPATISRKVKGGYGIWLHGEARQHAHTAYYELADLRQLQTDFNISMEDLPHVEVAQLLNESIRRSNKRNA